MTLPPPDQSQASIPEGPSARIKRVGIDTYQQPVVYMRHDSSVCRSEGFESQSRVRIQLRDRQIIAILNVVMDGIVKPDEAGLSEVAWELLGARDGDIGHFSHPVPLVSLSYIRSKIYGNRLSAHEIEAIVQDIVSGRLADVHLAAFLTASALNRLSNDEIIHLTGSMIKAGERLTWTQPKVMDKHCIGGLPGNRTSLIVVPIVAASGLIIPKTSSRAITSPAGTADAMETLAPVNLSLDDIRRVIERENGCIVWGGSVNLSPADDVLIRVERVLDLDSEGQLVASVLSKKISAGSTHVVIDIPIGHTAKIRTHQAGESLADQLREIGTAMGIDTKVVLTDGSQPIGRGIGPALEARDALAVLQRQDDAPADLRDRALLIAGEILEQGGVAPLGKGAEHAGALLSSGAALTKFEAICDAQGGMRTLPRSSFQRAILAHTAGRIENIDNRRLAKTAKLAGAPRAPAAGLKLRVRCGDLVNAGDELFVIHAEAAGELDYAMGYAMNNVDMIQIQEPL